MSYTLNLASGIVTRDADGAQVAPAQSVTDTAYIGYVSWCGAGNTPAEVNIPVASGLRKLTPLAFRNRFTPVEKITMEMMSLDDPTAPLSQRKVAAALRVSSKDVDNAKFVDLQRADTAAGVNQLVLLGVLNAERAHAILTDPIQIEEEWKE